MKLVLAICLLIVGAVLVFLFLGGGRPTPMAMPDRIDPKHAQSQPVDLAEVSAPTESSERSSAALAEVEAQVTPPVAAYVDTIPRDPVAVLVVDKATGKPVAGAEVIWANMSENERLPPDPKPRWNFDRTKMPATARRTTTNAAGLARIDSSVYPGRILARHDRSWGETFLSTEQPQPVRVEIEPDLGLVIQVVDANARPIPGVPVCLRELPHTRSMHDLWAGTTSGKLGTASVPRLDAARRAEFSKGPVYAMLDFPTREGFFVPVDLDNIPAEPVQLVLPPHGSVVVALRNADGRPTTADAVFLGLAEDVGKDGNLNWGARAFEAERFENGEAHYTFIGLGLDLHVTARRMPTRKSAGGPGPHTNGEVVRFELDLGDAQPVLVGRLVLETGEPIRDRWVQTSVNVNSAAGSGAGTKPMHTDGEGRFRLPVAGKAGQRLAGTLTIQPIGTGAGEAGSVTAEVLIEELREEHDLGDIVVITPRIVGAGVVVDDFGDLVPYAVLVLTHSSRDVEGGKWRSSTALESRMKLDGSFTILAMSDIERVRVRAMRNGYANGQDVEFDPVRHDLRLVLPRACEISGHALIDGDIGPGRVRVIVFDHGADPRTTAFTSERETYVDLDGSFRLKRLAPGRFDVEFRIGRDGETLWTVADVDVPPGGKAMDARLDAVNLLGRVPAAVPR